MTLIGLRLGATLALLCATQRQDIEQVVLWEPSIRGQEYLREIVAHHETWLAGSFARRGARCERGIVREALGFPLTASLQAECSEYCDLSAVAKKPAPRVLIIDGEDTIGRRNLAGRLEELGVDVAYRQIRHPPIWKKGNRSEEKGLVPLDVLQCIRMWMSGMPV